MKISKSGPGAAGHSPWFAVRVRPRSEFRASGELSIRGFETFLPARRVRRRWSDRTKALDEALFPGYLFCRFQSSERVRVVEIPGILQVVGAGNTPIPIPDAEIASIQRVVASEALLTPWPYLRVGQRVRIEAGPLAGVEGVVIRSEGAKPRVVVSVTLLQRSIAAELDRDWIGLAG